MTRRNTGDQGADDRTADGLAEIEALQAAAAEAVARAESATGELAETKGRVSALEAELADTQSARESEASELRSLLDAARAQVRDAAVKYREARLAASPEVLPELVPESEDIAEVERGFEAAGRLVSQVRERIEEASQARTRSARVPAGAPPRKAADMSSLSAAEKIRMGLERLSDSGGR